MAKTNYAGIDYGMGQANIDTETGIRYGLISQNLVSDWALEFFWSIGDDLDYQEFRQQVIDEIRSAIERAIQDYTHDASRSVERIDCEEIFDGLEIEYESESNNLELEDEDGKYQLSGGNVWVFRSKYYTHAQFCSPCMPGAGNLDCPCPDGPKTYCVGPDWFDADDQPDGRHCPYPVYLVETGECIYTPPGWDDDSSSE